MSQDTTVPAIPVTQAAAEGAALQRNVRVFSRPLLGRLASRLDVRLVRTLRDSVEAVLRSRDRPQAIWLTELGAVLLGAQRTPAGVKRLSRLLRAAWSSDEIEQWLLEQADEEIARHPVGEALVLLDEGVAEKPESLRTEGLCRVRSGKARRLARSRRGFSGGPPPPRPVTVPGIHWLTAIVTGLTGGSGGSVFWRRRAPAGLLSVAESHRAQ